MEVHHHAHTPRKKWSHYFWEFLMLFLAVFCGFLAEYKLEHVIEHNREKEYIKSMYEDLRQDTTEINRAISVISDYGYKSDTLLNMLEKPISKSQNELMLLYKLQYSLGAESATLSQRTLAQLKNAGGSRLIRNKGVADGLSLYDSKAQYLSAIFKSYDEVSTMVLNAARAIFDNRYIRHNFQGDIITLLTYDQSTIRQYANSLHTYQAVGNYYVDYLQQHKKFAIELMSSIKKSYQLE